MQDYFEQAITRDQADKLARFRDYFSNNEQLIYLDGNSLGQLPLATKKLLNQLVAEQWGERLLRGWNEQWMDLPSRLAAKIAKLVGAQPDEIFVGDSTSLNLYKLAFAALMAQKRKTKIVSDELNFPTDLYVLQGLIKQQFHHHQLLLIKSPDGISIGEEQLEKLLDNQTALLTLSHVAFKSAFMYNMKNVNELAHKKGALVIWDLSHAAGAVDLELNASGADMAVGCTYKYINGGPGASAFLYVRKDLQVQLINPIASWFGHNKPFDFDRQFQSADNIRKFGVGTPNILSMAAMEPGLDLLLEAGMPALRRKSEALSVFMLEMIQKELVPLGFSVASPMQIEKRGSHLSIQHPEAYRINRAMIEPKDTSKAIIPDFRPPDLIRMGFAPLYNRFEEMAATIQRIKNIVSLNEFERFGKEKLTVT
ncbi:MAG: kynureninase [Bacteroidetes bacterium]|nr:kynureninase [Bacteroidota bacterium]MBU1579573.1 kynureninase [Bacteroidota bacterium]